MRPTIILILSLLLGACVKEKTTTYEAFIVNGTVRQVEMYPYKNGYVNAGDTIRLAPGQTIQIAYGHNRGKVNRAGFSSKYFGSPDDSILVIFNNLYYVTHYANQPNNLSTKYLLFSSNRNIENPLSYEYEYWDIDKYARRAKYTYTFTEDDYDFAKN